MGRSRNTRSDKEFSKEQKLAHENRELRKALAKLRKKLDRMDHEAHEEIQEVLEEAQAAERQAEQENEKKPISIRCDDCGKGNLAIFQYQKITEPMCYWQCGLCGYRTKSQVFVPEGDNRPKLAPLVTQIVSKVRK
jgi:hypothetical protein